MSSEIKVSSVKAKDGTAGISIANSTGNVSLSGTLSAGTLGANVAFNDAHKDIRKEDYILLGFATNTDYNSMSDIASTSSSLWGETYKGSGITHPYHPTGTAEYGRFKVSKAGIYLVWFSMHNNGSTNDYQTIYLVRNGDYLDGSHSSDTAGNKGGRAYMESGSEFSYPDSGTKIIAIPLNANDYLNLFGEGNFFGGGTDPMGQFGAIRLGDRI